MQFAGRPSWSVRFDAAPFMLHVALLVRESLAVSTHQDPPNLLPLASWQALGHRVPEVPDADALFHDWWTALLRHPQRDHLRMSSLWPLLPEALRPVAEALDDSPHRW